MATAVIQPQHVPSHMRTVPGSVNIPIAKFPSAPKTTETVDAAKVAGELVDAFNQTVHSGDYAAVSNLFVDGGYWRDHLALSWVFRTVQTPVKIREYLENCAKSKDGFRLKKIAVDDGASVKAPKILPIDASGNVLGIQFFVKVETVLGTGLGLVRLAEQDGQWKIFTLYTRLEELKGHEEAINERRPKGAEHGGKPGRKNWAEKRALAADFKDGSEPTVLVVGKLSILKLLVLVTQTNIFQALARPV